MAPRFRFSARLKRRMVFAAPLVVSLTACTNDGGGKARPPVVVKQPPPKPAKNTQNIQRRDDGTCWEYFDVECDPGDSCNPPPPMKVECPEELKPKVAANFYRVGDKCFVESDFECPTGEPGEDMPTCNPPPPEEIPCPEPEPVKVAKTVWKEGDKCFELMEIDCPKPAPGEPEITCNPPGPMEIPCPSQDTKVVKKDDGTCEEVYAFDCAPDVKCNPPAPKPVDCPADMK